MVDALAPGWYSELSSQLWPGQCMSLEYEKILEDVKSDFQHVVVFQRSVHWKFTDTDLEYCTGPKMPAHMPHHVEGQCLDWDRAGKETLL